MFHVSSILTIFTTSRYPNQTIPQSRNDLQAIRLPYQTMSGSGSSNTNSGNSGSGSGAANGSGYSIQDTYTAQLQGLINENDKKKGQSGGSGGSSGGK